MEGTNLLTGIIQKSKASAGLSPKASIKILDDTFDEYKQGGPWADAIRAGRMYGVGVESNPEAFKRKFDEQQKESSSRKMNGTVKVIGPDGVKFNLPHDKVQGFLEKYKGAKVSG